MRNTLLISCLILFLGCNFTSKNKISSKDEKTVVNRSISKIDSLIELVPITKLPIGWNRLYYTDSIKYSYNYECPQMFYTECNLELDMKNKYKLNNVFSISSLHAFEDNLSIAIPKKMIFAKRLPNIGSQKVLIYYIEALKNDTTQLPCWILLKTDIHGKIVKDYLIAGISWGENDTMSQMFFYITQKYFLYARSYMQFKFNKAEEIEEGVNPLYIYSTPEVMVLDLTKDVVKYETIH